MYRSPAEYYIKYLISIQSLSDGEVVDRARELGISFIPGEVDYVKWLRKSLIFPRNYDPKNPYHKPSLSFMYESGIFDMWYPSEATHRALDLFSVPEVRELVCRHLSTDVMPLDKLETFLQNFYALDVPVKVLREFRHYFWNLQLLSNDERQHLLNGPQTPPATKTIANLPRDAFGPLVLLWKSGHTPLHIDRAGILYYMRNIAFLNAIEADRTMYQGMNKSTTMRNYFEIVKQSQEKIDENEIQEKGIIDEFYKHVSITDKTFDPPSADVLGIEIKEISNANLLTEDNGSGEGTKQ
jgi:hypothetical protein